MIYNIYKPKDLSSFSIVKKVKNITKEKVGHSGTLDPFADGVLVLGVGKSTKKLSNIIQFDKTYEGIIKLGEKTDSMDLTGNIVEEKEVCEISEQRKFWLCFNKNKIISDKTILLAESDSDPSIVESFLIDEKKTTLPLLISRVLQRLNGQKLIGVN